MLGAAISTLGLSVNGNATCLGGTGVEAALPGVTTLGFSSWSPSFEGPIWVAAGVDVDGIAEVPTGGGVYPIVPIFYPFVSYCLLREGSQCRL
jgi:hypothetical protein